MARLAFTVIGVPAPQGSKRHVGNGVMVESSAKVKPWRQDVVAAAVAMKEHDNWGAPVGPVSVSVTFFLPRPKGHYRTGKFAHLLRDNAPGHCVKPDIDKLVRSTLDALTTAGVLRDDAQVHALHAHKAYADHEPVGASLLIQGGSDD